MAAERRRAIVLADGAVPGRSALDAAWPGWADDVGLVIAADGGARNARALGLHVGRWVGDGDSIDARELAALEASGVPIERLPTAKDASDTEVALLAAAERADEIVLLGALGGERLDHGLANLGLLEHPSLERILVELYDEHGARIRLLRAVGGRATAALDGRAGDLVSLLPIGGTADGVTTEGLGYPLVDEPLVLGSSRGLSNVKTQPRATVTLRSGRLLVIETPVTVPAMTAETPTIPEVGEVAPAVVLPDETGTVHDLNDQRGRWTVLYFYPKDDTPGCNTEACQFRDLDAEYAATDADVWGVSKDSAESHLKFRQKFDLPFVLLTDLQKDVIERYGAWGEKTAMGRTYMGILRSTFLIDPDGRIARVWPKVKADGHAAQVLEALGEERAARAAG